MYAGDDDVFVSIYFAFKFKFRHNTTSSNIRILHNNREEEEEEEAKRLCYLALISSLHHSIVWFSFVVLLSFISLLYF